MILAIDIGNTTVALGGGGPYMAGYYATKAYVVSLTRGVAEFLVSGILGGIVARACLLYTSLCAGLYRRAKCGKIQLDKE